MWRSDYIARDARLPRPRPGSHLAGVMADLATTDPGELNVEPGPGTYRNLVATILPASGPTGVQTHIREVCDYFASRGNLPEVVTPYSWGGPLYIPMFGMRGAIHPFSGSASIAWYRYWHYAFLRRALERALARPGAAIVYAQCPLSAKAAIEARRNSEKKVVVAIHSNGSQADEWVDKNMLRAGSRQYRSIIDLEREFLPQVDGIVYVSEAGRKGMAGHVQGLDKIPSVVVPNFVSAPRVEAGATRTRDLVTVGGLEIAKNHEYLLRIIEAANRNGHRYTLDLVGDGPCRRSLEQLSRSLGLEGQVRFLGSKMDARSLLPAYKAYVHTSIRESLSMAIIEAMSCGLGIVAGAVGGTLELFEPGREGLVWPLDDPEAAAGILVGLLEDESELARLGAGARARFERRFDAAVAGPSLERFFLSTARCSRAPEVGRTQELL
jgi:glycosyltransferase involved in cell wall biosynthesis